MQRMVVKEVRPPLVSWRNSIMWRFDQQQQRLPPQICIHRRIDANRAAANGEDPEYLIGHRGHRVMMKDRRSRIYMDYCEGRDLDDALAEHLH